MKTTIHLNNYFTKGILILTLAVSVQSLISLHKHTLRETASGSSFFNRPEAGPDKSFATTALSNESRNKLNGVPAAVTTDRKIRKAVFIFNENLESNMISAAGLIPAVTTNDASPANLSANAEKNTLESQLIWAADIYIPANTMENEENIAVDSKLEQYMIEAAGLNERPAAISESADNSAGGSELEQEMIMAAGLSGVPSAMVNEDADQDFSDQLTEVLMTNAAWIYKPATITASDSESGQNDFLENLMIRAASIYSLTDYR